ncbi:MAG: CDP-glycerol glycerophosphotransferase family protein, partial [Fusobacteriaceae bacterium]
LDKKFIKNQLKKNKKLEKELKEKEVIKVAFFVVVSSGWKLERIYKEMLKNSKFEPIIIICPRYSLGESRMFEELDIAEIYFKEKGYDYKKSYNKETKSWLDVKKEIKPDIIFYENPHVGTTMKEYSIENNLDTLSCYIPYFLDVVKLYDKQYNSFFHKMMWKIFTETDYNREVAKNHCDVKDINRAVVGAPMIEIYLDKDYKTTNPWKNDNRKKIIWAPHQMLNDNPLLKLSTFETYYKSMIQLAQKYKSEIQIAFKPHPRLKEKLEKKWGIKKTEEYYNFWISGENTFLVEGAYEDLFLTSDALMHDCASFTLEYLYLNKPTLYLNDKNMQDRKEIFNDFGYEAYLTHYKAFSKDDIEQFINSIILKNEDYMALNRKDFLEKKLLNEKLKNPSKNIVDYLESCL